MDFLIARSILSFGKLAALADCMADLNLAFIVGSGDPSLAATVISLDIFANKAPLFYPEPLF